MKDKAIIEMLKASTLPRHYIKHIEEKQKEWHDFILSAKTMGIENEAVEWTQTTKWSIAALHQYILCFGELPPDSMRSVEMSEGMVDTLINVARYL